MSDRPTMRQAIRASLETEGKLEAKRLKMIEEEDAQLAQAILESEEDEKRVAKEEAELQQAIRASEREEWRVVQNQKLLKAKQQTLETAKQLLLDTDDQANGLLERPSNKRKTTEEDDMKKARKASLDTETKENCNIKVLPKIIANVEKLCVLAGFVIWEIIQILGDGSCLFGSLLCCIQYMSSKERRRIRARALAALEKGKYRRRGDPDPGKYPPDVLARLTHLVKRVCTSKSRDSLDAKQLKKIVAYMRELLTTYVDSNPYFFAGFYVSTNGKSYIEEMSKPGCYGGDSEINAFTQIFGTDTWMAKSTDDNTQPPIVTEEDRANVQICLAFFDTDRPHYDAVVLNTNSQSNPLVID